MKTQHTHQLTKTQYTHNHHAHATTEPFSIGIIQPKPFTTNRNKRNARQQSNKACLGMSHTKYSTSHFKRKRNSMKVLLYVVGAEGTTNAVYL